LGDMDDLPYLVSSVDVEEDVDALVAPPTHHGIVIVVVDVES
jgi:hypothetical protein